jgi:glycosyltransferase involved in cell wall biosynthesis
MSLPLPISVVVVARNEAHNLPRCLASVGGWCADLIVALNDTRDDSERVARAAGARVQTLEWQGYRDTKNAALALARHDWVLSLDADEEVSPALRETIIASLPDLIANSSPVRVFRARCGSSTGGSPTATGIRT